MTTTIDWLLSVPTCPGSYLVNASNISVTGLINQSSFIVDYPRELSLVEGSSTTIYVKVSNNSNTSLSNVWLDLQAPACVSVLVSRVLLRKL